MKKTGKLVIVQEAIRRGGVASDIASIVQERAFSSLGCPIRILAGKNTPIPYNKGLEKLCVPQEDDIVDAVSEVVDGS